MSTVDVNTKLVRRAGKVLKQYGEVLGLDGWSIEIGTASPERLDEMAGGGQHDQQILMLTRDIRPGLKAARIFINETFDFDGDHLFSFEGTLVHELAHVVLAELGMMDLEGYSCADDCYNSHLHSDLRQLNEKICDRISLMVMANERKV